MTALALTKAKSFRINFKSLKFKFGLLYTLVLGIILVLFSATIYGVVTYFLYVNIDNNLTLRTREILRTINEYESATKSKQGIAKFAAERVLTYDTSSYPVSFFDAGKIKRLDSLWQARADALGIKDNYTAFVFLPENQFLKSKNFPSGLVPPYRKFAKTIERTKRAAFININLHKMPLRVIGVPFRGKESKDCIMLLGISQASNKHLLSVLRKAIFWGVPLMVFVAIFVGHAFIRRVLNPIEEIAKTANRISLQDLSARVKTEHLDAEIEYLVAAFNDMISRLQKSFEHINEFSGRVAHELKTPLAIIKGESELALSQERSTEEYRNAIKVNYDEAERMRKTVEDLLLLARVEYEPEVFKLKSFDFMEFFREIYEQSQFLAAPKEITVEAQIPSQAVMINADKLHLRRLFFNVIDNALKFTMPKGKVTLKVFFKRKRILVLVTDTGVGIPPEDLSRIFDKFYHVDRTGHNYGKCSGLGLSIVRSILRFHNGQIHVTSKVGQGTTFHIMLPV